MPDIYDELFAALLQKSEQNSGSEAQTVNDRICNIADRLRQSESDERRFDAGLAYYIAGYYVRAFRLVSQTQTNVDAHPAQRWLALFLRKQFADIGNQARAAILDSQYDDPRISQAVSQQGLTDSEALDLILTRCVADVFGHFLVFVRAGDRCSLDKAFSTLSRCKLLALKASEPRWWWWRLEFLRLVMSEFAANCLWTQLEPMSQERGGGLVSKYIIANYEWATPVVELWRTQTESLGKINDPDRASFCLSVPTGSGKTRVAELAILRFLLDCQDDPDAKCVYIAPFRRLANEVEKSLAGAFSDAKSNLRIVSTFYGGNEVDYLDQEELDAARILVVTPEKLDGMLRSNPNLLSQIRLVIADEGHMLGEIDDTQNRGYKYRALIERLVYALRIKPSSSSVKARLLLISGVLPNAGDFAELISGNRANVVDINWRPLSEPVIGTWEWDGSRLGPPTGPIPPPVLLHAPGCGNSREFSEVVVRAAFSSAMVEPTFVFSASKKAIKAQPFVSLLVCLSKHQPLGDFPILPTFPRRGGFEEYYQLLERGIAIHHAALPAALKRETEERIYSGRVRLLFASPTLAQGVNMPFDKLLVYRLHYWPNNRITDAGFWNVVGRVGRPVAGNSRGGERLDPPRVVFLHNKASRITEEDRREARESENIRKRKNTYLVSSPFLDFLKEIKVKWESLNKGAPVEELVELLGERGDLAWINNPNRDEERLSKCLALLDDHLSALHEESGIESEDWLQQISQHVVDLLVGATTIEEDDLKFIREAVLARARFIANVPKEKRRQDYLLGLPRGDCEIIRAKQDDLLDWYCGCTMIFQNPRSGVDNLVNILDIVQDLSICPRKWHRRKFRSAPIPSNQLPLLPQDATHLGARWTLRDLWENWILGTDMQTIADAFSSTLINTTSSTDFDAYREEMLEGRLAWGVSAICRFLDDVAHQKGWKLPEDLQFLPSLVKYGVPGKLHCYFVRRGLAREEAAKGAELCIAHMRDMDESLMPDQPPSTPLYAQQALGLLSEDDIESLCLSENSRDRIRQMRAAVPSVS